MLDAMSLRQNALLLVALTGLLAIAGLWSPDSSLTGLWRLPLALLLLGLAYEVWLARRAQFAVRVCGEMRGFLGRPMTLSYRFSHRLGRDVAIELAPSAPETFSLATDVHELTASADHGASLDLRVTPRRLGHYEWPAPRLRVAGALGLAWWSRPAPIEYSVQVAPEILDDVVRRHGAAHSGAKLRPVLGGGAEILQLRDYVPGDPQRLIDWKASARRERLISRDYTEDQHLEIVIAIDAGRTSGLRAGELDRLGHYANVAARFAEHAIAQDDRVGLIVYADRPLAVLSPGRGVAAVTKVRRVLATMKVAAAESNPLNAVLRIRTLVKHRSLIVILTDLDDATVASQLASAARLLLPKHLPLIVGLASPEAEALAQAPADNWLGAYHSLAAQEYCQRLSQNVRALHALGAPALHAQPNQLERAVLAAYADFRLRRRI